MTAESAKEEPSGKMLKCSHCPKEFRYNSERNRHEMSHSPGFECDVCCKKFSFISALRRHQKQHERTGSVKCEECSRKFRDEVLLKRHMKYAHKGTFSCTKCSAPFSSDQALHTHMKSHRPVAERRFKCSFNGCSKSFNFSHHLKHHELTHTNAKQHYCCVCGKGFIQSHHLKTHLKTHDPSEWLFCEHSGCKKKFSTEYARKRHMVVHKNKADSGISSDSNSCDTSISRDNVEDTVLCTSCGENILEKDYFKHSVRCGDILDNSDIKLYSDSPIKEENEFVPSRIEQRLLSDKYLVENDIDDCKTALGGCIMNGNNCVCDQISGPIKENYNIEPIERFQDIKNEVDVYTNDINKSNDRHFNIYDYCASETVLKRTAVIGEIVAMNNLETDIFIENRDTCEGCECASNCNIKPSNCNRVRVVPNVEYKANGVVKIRDTFDLDIPIKAELKDESFKFIPFNTCREVIGNCLVGGSEGCLCARMMADDQQAMAQEIDDITPKPKTANYVM